MTAKASSGHQAETRVQTELSNRACTAIHLIVLVLIIRIIEVVSIVQTLGSIVACAFVFIVFVIAVCSVYDGFLVSTFVGFCLSCSIQRLSLDKSSPCFGHFQNVVYCIHGHESKHHQQDDKFKRKSTRRRVFSSKEIVSLREFYRYYASSSSNTLISWGIGHLEIEIKADVEKNASETKKDQNRIYWDAYIFIIF